MTKELAVKNDFAIMDPSVDVRAILAENLGGEGLSAFDLDRIKVPSGGGKMWSIPTLDGEVSSEHLDGVLIYSKITRSYWSESFDQSGGGSPPDCVSDDGIVGVGNPGGSCIACPLAQYGTANDGTGAGQACQMRRVMFLLQADSTLPVVVSVPPASLKNSKQFLIRLAKNRIPMTGIITRLSLEPDKNAKGIKYSKIVFSKAGDVPAPEVFRAYADSLRPHLDKAAADIARQNDEDMPPM